MNPNPHTRCAIGLVACLALFTVTASGAAAEDRWYQVELLVFSNEFSAPGEQWEPTPALAYPGAARFLIEPLQVKANLAAHNASSVVDEFGRQILTLLPEPDATDARPDPTGPRSGPDPAATDPNSAAVVPEPEPALRPTPFIALPPTQREFRGKAAYMQRTGRYQILFHQSWVQPVRDRSAALPLVLDRSGDTGQWPRLQGSVKLYLSRYLHLETNLWLNTSGYYLPNRWRMPAPPLGPPSLIIEPLPDPQEAATLWGIPGEQPGPLSAGQEAPVEPEEEQLEPEEEQLEPEGVYLEPEEALEPIYPFRHAVLLRQKRRMRSNEVHYIDHPLFGIVVKLIPIAEEELRALALAQERAEAGDR